jgi:hypothetical protein
MLKGVQLDFEDWVPGSGKLKFPHHGASLTYDQRGVRVTNLWTYAAAEWTIRRVKSLLLADNGDAEDRRGTVRVIDTVRALDKEWIDFRTIGQWIDDCSTLHEEECDNPMNIPRAVPDLLVDVERKCIVRGKGSFRYMALSYRLGDAAPFSLRISDLDAFGKHGILDDAQVLERSLSQYAMPFN